MGYRAATVLLIPLFAVGCAVVDAGPDYERARDRVRSAVGAESVFDPDDPMRVERRVDELLADSVTADEAVEICLLQNPALQSLFYRIGLRRADVVQSQLLSNPSVGVTARLPAGGGLANIETGLAQNIVDLWQLPLRKERAERALDQAVLELAHEAAALAADARGAYFESVAADDLVDIAAENRASAEELFELTQRLRDAGAATLVDVNLSRVELQEAELAVRSAELSAFEARTRLARLMGLDGRLDVALAEPLPGPPDAAPGLADMLRAAADSRMDLLAARRELEALSADVAIERGRVFRVVEIGVELEREARGASSDGRFLGNAVRSSIAAGQATLPPGFGDKDEDSDVSVGPSLRVELPVFDQNQAQIAKAEFALLEAARQVQALLVGITQDVRLAHQRGMTAWDIARFYATELLPVRERNLELAREAYRGGKVALIPVIEAQRNLQRARAGYVRALRDGALAWTEIERVTARPRQRLMEMSHAKEAAEEAGQED